MKGGLAANLSGAYSIQHVAGRRDLGAPGAAELRVPNRDPCATIWCRLDGGCRSLRPRNRLELLRLCRFCAGRRSWHINCALIMWAKDEPFVPTPNR